ncbi:MAG: hypothetical protein ACO331_02895 [Prochlorothrix sp.]
MPDPDPQPSQPSPTSPSPSNTPDPDLRQLLTEFQAEMRQGLVEVRQDVGNLQEELARSRQELQEEVKRWDNRFFEFSRDSLNRANTLIASATISVIAGVILLLLRQN